MDSWGGWSALVRRDGSAWPTASRVHDCFLDGALHLTPDRVFAAEQVALYPDIKRVARANHVFLQKVVRHMLCQGVRQIVDLGAGMSVRTGVLDVADQCAPGELRMVSVDRDPVAYCYAEAELARCQPRRHRALRADLLAGEGLWRAVLGTGVIDPAQPVGVLAVGMLHFIPREHHPETPLAYLRNQLADGSFLAISHASEDTVPESHLGPLRQVQDAYRSAGIPAVCRSREEIVLYFGEWPLLAPGLVPADAWHPDDTDREGAAGCTAMPLLAGVARKHESIVDGVSE